MAHDGEGQRRRILAWLAENEGAHLAAIIRALGLGNNQAAFHLRVLEREGRVWSRRDGRLLRLHTSAYATNTPAESLPSPPVIHAAPPLRIRLLDLLARPASPDASGPEMAAASQSALAQALDRSQQLISYHLKSLEQGGFIQREGSSRAGHWRVTAAGMAQLAVGLEALPQSPPEDG